MLGRKKITETVNRRITTPVTNAVIIACVSLIVAVIALFLAVAADAH